MTLLIAVGGMLVLTGLALAIALAAGVQMPAKEPARADGRRSWLSRHWRDLLVAVPVGVVAMLATGWVAAGLRGGGSRPAGPDAAATVGGAQDAYHPAAGPLLVDPPTV